MGTKGMKTSLVSREVIADSIELTARGYQFDAVVALSACDKTIPGCVMALARLDIPALMLYGGSIAPGRWRGKDVTILDVFEAIGAHAAGEHVRRGAARARGRRQPRRRRLRRPVHRQHDGLRLRGARDLAGGLGDGPRRGRRQGDGRRADRRAGDAGARRGPAPEPDHHPRLARERDRRASAPRAARPTGSCTCSRSPARRASSSTIDDFERISRRTPLLADLKPGGRFVATDLYRAGGVPLILNRLAEAGLLHRDAITVTGRTIGEEADAADGGSGPGGRAPAVRPAQARGRPRDPARQPRPRGLGGQARRHRAPRPDRPGAGLRVRGGVLPRRSRTRRSSPATSS